MMSSTCLEYEAGETARQTYSDFQLADDNSLEHEQMIYYTSLYDSFLTPTVTNNLYQEIPLPTSASDSGHQHFDWDTSYGINT